MIPVARNTDVAQVASSTLAGIAGWTPQLIDDFSTLALNGLFLAQNRPPIELYTHQVEMLRASVALAHDTVILTGTGSGKNGGDLSASSASAFRG